MSDDKEVSRIVSINDLSAKVDKLFEMLTGNGNGAKRGGMDREGASSLDEQIKRAVQSAGEEDRKRSASEQREAEVSDRLKKLEERSEKPPKEYRRLTKVFWGGDE